MVCEPGFDLWGYGCDDFVSCRDSKMSKVGSGDSKNTLYCSFCGKGQHEVIAGPTVFICDECVELCMDIIDEEHKSSLVKWRGGIPTPKEIRKVRAAGIFSKRYAPTLAIERHRCRHELARDFLRIQRCSVGGQTSNTIAQFALDFPRKESVCGDHGHGA
jgi:hypothetical protein